MYGSELVPPNATTWHDTIKYQHDKCFLGLLGPNENLAHPGGTMKSMFYAFMNHAETASPDTFYVFAFTDPSRESWYDSTDREWKHSSWITNGTNANNVNRFDNSYKDYVTHTWSEEYERMQYVTMASAMMNTAKAKGFKYIGFNSLPAYSINDKNMFWSGTCMKDHLLPNHFASGGHPNEEGHIWIAERVKEFIDTAYPNLI